MHRRLPTTACAWLWGPPPRLQCRDPVLGFSPNPVGAISSLPAAGSRKGRAAGGGAEMEGSGQHIAGSGTHPPLPAMTLLSALAMGKPGSLASVQ